MFVLSDLQMKMEKGDFLAKCKYAEGDIRMDVLIPDVVRTSRAAPTLVCFFKDWADVTVDVERRAALQDRFWKRNHGLWRNRTGAVPFSAVVCAATVISNT